MSQIKPRTQFLILCIFFLLQTPVSAAQFSVLRKSTIDLSASPRGSTSSTSTAPSTLSTTTTSTVTETGTIAYSFIRYFRDYYGYMGPWFSGSSQADYMNGLALRSDHGIALWLQIYGIFSNNIEETWTIEHRRPDGALLGGGKLQSTMETIDGIYQKCFTMTNIPTGQVVDRFCRNDPEWKDVPSWSIQFWWGVARRPTSSEPIEIDRVQWTQNGTVRSMGYWAPGSYLLADVQLINPNPPADWAPPLIDKIGRLITDPAVLVTASPIYSAVRYAVCDGDTPLMIRVGTLPTVPVTLSIVSNSTADGTLTALDGSQGPTMVQPPLQLVTGTYYGFGLYTVPQEFSDTLSSLASRPMTLQASFTIPDQSSPGTIQQTITLLRPPVVLIHGMWSTPAVWNSLIANPAFNATRLWKQFNWAPAEASLRPQIVRLGESIQNMFWILRHYQVAMTHVDVVTHSAGGVLARLWAQEPTYRRVNNFLRGDYRKLITVGTPHKGAPIATFVQQLIATNSLIVNLLKVKFDLDHRSLTKGIVSDMQPTSAVISSLRQVPTKSFAWIGDAPTLPVGSDFYRMWRVLARTCAHSTSQSITTCQGIQSEQDYELLRSRVMAGLPNDAVVTQPSQTGGLSVSSTGLLTNTLHTDETIAPDFISQLSNYLDTTSGFDDAGFQ